MTSVQAAPAASTAEASEAPSASARRAFPSHTADFHRDVVCLMGLPFDVMTMRSAVERVRDAAFGGRRCFISTPNLNFVVEARKDVAFRNSVLCSDLSLVDGMPLVWLSRALGLPIRERVPGAGLFDALLEHPGEPISVYFFGGAEGVSGTACRRINERGIGIRCVGHDTPGFGSVDEMSSEERIERINASGAQFVSVSLGARKGQAWIQRNAHRLTAPVICHLGAVVNIAAGTVKRAPAWMQDVGLEWLWRVKEEPALWKRYSGDAKAVAGWIVKTRRGGSKHSRGASRNDGELLPTLTSSLDHGAASIALGGAWTRATLGPLRTALTAAAHAADSIEIDVRELSRIDSSFIGLMLLALGHFGTRGAFALTNVAPQIRLALSRHGADYLCEAVHKPATARIQTAP